MVSVTQLAWAAGFLEGEGSFGCYYGTPRVTAAQVQKEPLDRLQAMFGGSMWLKQPTGFSKQPIFTWMVGSRRSAEVMMTLFSFMSPKRKDEIERALVLWKAARRMSAPGAPICLRGHAITGYNAQYVPSRRFPVCRECKNTLKRLRRQKLAFSAEGHESR